MLKNYDLNMAHRLIYKSLKQGHTVNMKVTERAEANYANSFRRLARMIISIYISNVRLCFRKIRLCKMKDELF